MAEAAVPEPVPEQIRAIPVRHWGRWLVAGIIVVIVIWLVRTAVESGFADTDLIRGFLFDDKVLKGVGATILISVVAQVTGIMLGVVFAAMRVSKNPVMEAVSWFYVWFFRGTPVIVQLFFWFFAVPQVFATLTIAVPFTDIELYSTPMVEFMTPFMAAFLGLALNEGAYMAEIVRAGVLSVEEGQIQAAHGLGMTSAQTMRRIVLPQAIRVIIPPTGNEFISMLKTSSLAAFVLFEELFRRVDLIASAIIARMEMLIVASIWYVVLTSVFSVGQYYLERHFARVQAQELPGTPFQRVRRLALARPRM